MAVVHRYKRPEHDHSLVGLWYIYEMEMWDEDYFNMETQAYIEITPSNGGESAPDNCSSLNPPVRKAMAQ
jgi:hypothetical protein